MNPAKSCRLLPTPQQAAVLEFLAVRDTNVILCRWDTVFGWDHWRLWEPEGIDKWGHRHSWTHYLHPTVGLALVENDWVSIEYEYECSRHYDHGKLHGIGYSRTYAINAKGHDALVLLDLKKSD